MNFIQQFFTKQVAATLLRYALFGLGTFLAGRGYVDEAVWKSQVDAAVTTIVGLGGAVSFLYGLYTSTRKGLVARTEALPGVAVVPVPETNWQDRDRGDSSRG